MIGLDVDFNQQPFISIWETTQACDLACVHCRAQAQPNPLPGELTHAEGLALIEAVAQMGTPLLIFSGGDPLKRADLTELIRHGKAQGLRIGTIPAATPRLTREAVSGLQAAGLDQMALSVDASTAERHDRFRGVAGAFQKTMDAVGWAHEVGLPLQINTVLSAYNLGELAQLVALVRRCGIVFWEVFFLVPTGRGHQVAALTAEQYEQVFAVLYDTAKTAGFIVKITEGQHYRRYAIQRRLREAAGTQPMSSARMPGPPAQDRQGIGLARQTVNAGKGHLFISSTGEVYPSGFLPLSAGNIRATPLAELYRAAPLFQQLRNPALLKGRCGACEFRMVCGGSRARAYAMTGDYLAEDPCCAYRPATARLSCAAD